MILADHVLVCAKDFNNIRENNCEAIHMALEQQTVTIAKEGMLMGLNKRCLVPEEVHTGGYQAARLAAETF